MTNAFRHNVLPAIVSVIVIAGLVLAFRVMGSPSHARVLDEDRQRINDLEELAQHIDARYGPNGVALPHHIPYDLTLRNEGTGTVEDPVSHRPYEYDRDGPGRYHLCATFARPLLGDDASQGYVADTERHPAGHGCRAFTLAGGNHRSIPVTR